MSLWVSKLLNSIYYFLWNLWTQLSNSHHKKHKLLLGIFFCVCADLEFLFCSKNSMKKKKNFTWILGAQIELGGGIKLLIPSERQTFWLRKGIEGRWDPGTRIGGAIRLCQNQRWYRSMSACSSLHRKQRDRERERGKRSAVMQRREREELTES